MNGFEIISKLGEGSYSTVYKVKRKMDNKIYALKKVHIKKLSDKEKENSINEVRILASVKSPYVICYKEAFMDETGRFLCIVMEFGDKGDLYQKICQFKKKNYCFDELDIWRIFIQMVKGLKSLHDLKILHRDLKSANVFLFSDGTAKIGDLNVSKVAKKGMGYTQTGTPYYASPEVWNDEPYDNKSDIWSLACVTYEMLTLHPPFRAESMDGLYEKVIKGKYNKIDNKYSEDISQMIKLMLKVNPKERPSCAEILQNPIVVKRLEFFKNNYNIKNENDLSDDKENGLLLKTIRLPKNLYFLTNKLPKANYEKTDPNIHADVPKDKKYNLSNKLVALPQIMNGIKARNETPEKNLINDNSLIKNKEKIVLKSDVNVLRNNKSKVSIKSTKIRINNISPVIEKRNGRKSPSPEKILVRNHYGGSKCSIMNKGISELYKLYISNDARNLKGRYKAQNIYGVYLPNIFLKRDGSSKSIRSKVASRKKLNPLKS